MIMQDAIFATDTLETLDTVGTVFVVVTNDRDGLSQGHWVELIDTVTAAVEANSAEMQGPWTTGPLERRQTACWQLTPTDAENASLLKVSLSRLARMFHLDGITWVQGAATTIAPAGVVAGVVRP